MLTAKRILLVEDDSDDQWLFIEALRLAYPVLECAIANNGIEALCLIKSSQRYDIIFLDLNMPLMDGYECLINLKRDKQYKNVPVVVLSTSSSEKDKEKCKTLGAATFYTKPNSFAKLFDDLKNILSNGVNYVSS